jgi:hypothetical protein
MAELSELTKKLISQYKLAQQQNLPKQGVTTIHVDEFASSVAAFYEKIRMVVDWKEEHLMRRTAITRKLKRRFLNADLSNISSSESIAEPLILELVRTGHFPNDKIEESKIAIIQNVLNKYIYILRECPQDNNPRKKMQFYNWLIEIAACEIEENLATSRRESALIDYMFSSMKEKIIVSDKILKRNKLTQEEKNIQIYIAVQQSLYKLDNPLISYNLIKYKYPQWGKADKNFISEISQNVYKLWDEIDDKLTHPLGKKFYAICEKYDTPYLLLGDILSEENIEKISGPEVLEDLIKKAYNKRRATLRQRIQRAAYYSTLSALITNAFSVFLIEIPIAFWIYGAFSSSPFLTISVDIFAPTILMLFMVSTIKMPSKTNRSLVIIETMKIAYQKEKTDFYEIKSNRKKGVLTTALISFIYLATAVFSFWVIFVIFEKAKFPITSVIINITLISIISFAGLAIRKKGEELTIETKKTSFFSFLFDILSLPIAGAGRWLSNKWKKYNAIVAFFNAMIDAPFAVFVEFLEQWRYFIKDKNEEIR